MVSIAPKRGAARDAILVTGALGVVGRKLMPHLDGPIGLDKLRGTDFHADLSTVDFADAAVAAVLLRSKAVVHLATNANPQAPDDEHWIGVANSARLFAACRRAGVPRLVAASSSWADPHPAQTDNAYGRAKRVLEAMVEMYAVTPGFSGASIRIGFVPRSAGALQRAKDDERALLWSDEELVAAFREALNP